MKKQQSRLKLFITDFLLLNLSVFLVYMLKIRSFVSEEVFSSFNVTVFTIIIISLNFVWLLFFLIFYRKLSFIDKLEEYTTIFKGIFFGIKNKSANFFFSFCFIQSGFEYFYCVFLNFLNRFESNQ